MTRSTFIPVAFDAAVGAVLPFAPRAAAGLAAIHIPAQERRI